MIVRRALGVVGVVVMLLSKSKRVFCFGEELVATFDDDNDDNNNNDNARMKKRSRV